MTKKNARQASFVLDKDTIQSAEIIVDDGKQSDYDVAKSTRRGKTKDSVKSPCFNEVLEGSKPGPTGISTCIEAL